MKPNFRTWLIWQLRRISYKWPARTEALRAARIERGKYRCANCDGEFGNKQISLDHINPVIDPKSGWQGWEEYINRLFCKSSGFQVLCSDCHDQKTAREKKIRTKWKKKMKEAA